MSKNQQPVIVGLDIGTSNITCVVAESSPDGKLDVIGLGCHPSTGMRQGAIINIEETIQAITHAVQEASMMSGVDIHSAYVGITGNHIQSFNQHGFVKTRNGEITIEDVNRAIESASAQNISADRKILHILPQEYIVDDQDGIKDPIGMNGVRLEANIHMITGAISSTQNIIKCCHRCNLEIVDTVVNQIASAEAVLTQDERDMGVLLLDIGGGTTDMAIIIDGAVFHTAVIPVGGDHLSNDLVIGLRTSKKEADKLKMKHGACMVNKVPPNDVIEVPCVGGREPQSIQRQVMAQILEPRVQELFEMVREELERSGFRDRIAAGIVLTGGSSLLEGIVELAEDNFDNMPIRVGPPIGIGGLQDVVSNPEFATSTGLILYGQRYKHQRNNNKRASGKETQKKDSTVKRILQWFGSDSHA
ncbi:MAG: cell division protein FtsA [Zetaproteobacteria bacterium]|nr:cell division protein FtsA [Zetaproteobacteria bacterium]